MTAIPLTDPATVRLRHIVRATQATPGAVEVLPGRWYAPVHGPGSSYDGLNGDRGWQTGEYKRTLADEGTFAVTLPNVAGGDGVLHRRRFAVLIDDKPKLGCEFVEMYVGGAGDLKFVGPTDSYSKRAQAVEIRGVDALPLLDFERSGELDVWHHAPVDVFEHYCRANVLQAGADWRTDGPAIAFAAGDPSPSTSADGQFTAVRANTSGPAVRMAYTDVNQKSRVTTVKQLTTRLRQAWEAQWVMTVPALAAGQVIEINLDYPGANTIELTVTETGIPPFGTPKLNAYIQATGAITSSGIVKVHPGAKTYDLRLVARDNWMFFYVDGTLFRCFPRWPSNAAANVSATGVVAVRVGTNMPDADRPVLLHHFTLLESVPWMGQLMSQADLHLPGLPVPGGLRGRYFSETRVRSLNDTFAGTTAQMYAEMLAPAGGPEPVQRLDQQIAFSSGTTWAAVGGDYFSARWTGSIYLDLTGNGIKLRVIADDEMTVWIGRTHTDQWLMRRLSSDPGTVDSVNLRDILGPVKGWFPIRVDYKNGGGLGTAILQRSALDGSGTALGYGPVLPSELSPSGCFENTVRYESHRELLNQIRDTFGYQFLVAPYQLESGYFPAQLVPKVRVGRDTDVRVTSDLAGATQVSGSIRDSVDALIADAAGIADQAGAQQITARAYDMQAALTELFVHQDYVSLAELSEPEFVALRLKTIMTLRTRPLEEVTITPRGARLLTDTFPLTGVLALFDWTPGDGVRLFDPDVDLEDLTPRPLTSVAFPIRPAGRGAPHVSVGQRQRTRKQAQLDVMRETRAAKRNFQGQIAERETALTALGSDRDVPLPANLDDLLALEIVITTRAGSLATPWTVSINGQSVGLKVNQTGPVDITRYVQTVATTGQGQHVTVSVSGGSGTGLYFVRVKTKTR